MYLLAHWIQDRTIWNHTEGDTACLRSEGVTVPVHLMSACDEITEQSDTLVLDTMTMIVVYVCQMTMTVCVSIDPKTGQS